MAVIAVQKRGRWITGGAPPTGGKRKSHMKIRMRIAEEKGGKLKNGNKRRQDLGEGNSAQERQEKKRNGGQYNEALLKSIKRGERTQKESPSNPA